MKYRDFIQFDPITTVIQLRSADQSVRAKELVQSYVFSDTMAERFTKIVLPNLNFLSQNDSKALLVVGNYGTGKSHFMSVISAICEYSDLPEHITHSGIINDPNLPKVAGKYKVIRDEIGAVETPLSTIIYTLLKSNLAKMGVDITIPTEAVVNNKSILEDIMSSFQEQYPEHGLLIVIDELLDYLRSRDDQPLILDLGFLRELGEVCTNTRLRFVAGVQEAIFDSARFAFASDMLRRVRDRFEQVLIARNDIKYVVGERLLKKSDAQKAQIRQHLLNFTRFFPNMLNRIDEFVQLFPIHPDYITVFDSLRIIEKREVLKTLSDLMKRNLDTDVPTDQPGLFSYETYWVNIKENPVLRTDTDVSTVIERSEVIETRLTQLPAPKRPYALKMLHALSIQRLATPSINDPIGVTSAELRDALALYNPTIADMGGTAPDDDLKTYIESILRDIGRIMNNQFLTYNTANGHWYIDLQKTEDFEANISNRAASIDDNAVDRAYFNALKQLLELDVQPTHITGYNIWQYELEWTERRASRLGYLFFGAPNERSTAVPIREFYVYLLQPYAPPKYSDNQLADEVFIKLSRRDAEIDEALKFAAAATDLSGTAAGQSKSVYTGKAREYNQRVFTWLTHNMLKAFEVTHQGRTQLLESWYREVSRNQSMTQAGQLNFRDVMRAVASYCLNGHFVQRAPEYPKFSVRITTQNRTQAATEALRAIAGQNRTQQAQGVLDALQLIVSERIDASQSPFANHILSILHTKGDGQVVNQNEIITTQHTIGYMAPDRFRLEPELVVVVLAALIYTGHIELDVLGNKYDATKLQQLASTSIEQLIEFKHIKRPQDYNLPMLRSVMLLLGLPPGVAQSITQNNGDAVAQVQTRVQELITTTLNLSNILKQGANFWGRDVVSELGLANLGTQLQALKDFLERLTPYTTAARFKNMNFAVSDIEQHSATVSTIHQLRSILDTTNSFAQIVGWLTMADGIITPNHAWHAEYIRTRDQVVDSITQPFVPGHMSPINYNHIQPLLQTLKKSFVEYYIALHNQQRIYGQDTTRKQQLLNDLRYRQLNALAGIEILPRQQLTEFQNTVHALKECQFLSERDLEGSPMCPHCQYRPINEPTQVHLRNHIELLDNQLDTMLSSWSQIIRENLDDPTIHASMLLLNPHDRALIDTFIQSKSLPIDDIKSFVAVVNEVFRGFIAKRLTIRDFYRTLRLGDGAISPDVLKQRFGDWIDQIIAGNNPDQVRIIIDEHDTGTP